MSIAGYTGAKASQISVQWNRKYSIAFFFIGVVFSIVWRALMGWESLRIAELQISTKDLSSEGPLHVIFNFYYRFFKRVAWAFIIDSSETRNIKMQHPKPFVVRGLWGVLVVLQSTFFLWDKIQSRKIVALRDGHFFHVFKECGIYAWRAGQEPKILAVVRADKRPLVVFLIQAEYKIIRGKRPEKTALWERPVLKHLVSRPPLSLLWICRQVYFRILNLPLWFSHRYEAHTQQLLQQCFFKGVLETSNFVPASDVALWVECWDKGSGAQGEQAKTPWREEKMSATESQDKNIFFHKSSPWILWCFTI